MTRSINSAPERTTGVSPLLDGGQVVAACAAVRVSGARAVAWNLDANATAAPLVATGQQGSRFVVGHFESPFSVCGGRPVLWIDHAITLYPLPV